jgi:hypothetical protein
MGFTMTEILNMPIMDRKHYIHIHNEEVEKEKERFNKAKK